MKHLATICLVLLCSQVFGQKTTWTFVKVFPDTGFVTPYGVHGLAVAPDNNVWIGPTWATDSVKDAGNVWQPVVPIYVFRPNGTQTAFSGFKFIKVGPTIDTLYNGTGGMRADANGNIILASYDTYWRIDFKTGQGMTRVIPHAEDYVVSPGFTSANEMFTADVLPGNPIHILGSTFDMLGTAVESAPGFSRGLEVSKDGRDIFWAGYTLNKVLIYHSDLGSIGTYALKDSMAPGFQVESFAWNKKTGYLYMSGGNIDTADYGPFFPGHAAMQWVGFDVTTKTPKDTITWNWSAYPYLRTAADSPRPRAIDFSVSGDTAYVACFWQDKAAVQMFRRTTTEVSPTDEPIGYALMQNYPNPFNPTTEIRFQVPGVMEVKLSVFDLLGREVAELVNGRQDAGVHEVRFDGSKLPSGIYFYRLSVGRFQMTKKLLLLR